MIEIKGINKTFGIHKVLNDISLTIDEGKIYAILGHNGSGKTTLIKALLGLVVPDSGEIFIKHKSIINTWKYRKDIGYISQIARFPQNLTVDELFKMVSDIRGGLTNLGELIELFGLKKELNKKLGHLSGGTRQKVNVISALMINAPILICDEPTVGLDPSSLVKLKRQLKKLREQGKTILLITHITTLVEELADEIFLLQDGNLNFTGTVESLKNLHGKNNLEEALAKMVETQHE